MRVFTDRFSAGLELAQHLESLVGQDVVVLAATRGGIPVAFEVAEHLKAPLDVLLVHRLDVPSHPGQHFAAIGEDGARVVDPVAVRKWQLGDDDIVRIDTAKRAALRRRGRQLRGDRGRIPLAGRIAVVVDDGMNLATTVGAACDIARARGARKVVVAAPTGPHDVEAMLAGCADEVVCLDTVPQSRPLRRDYRHLPAVSDAELATLLDRAGRESARDAEHAVERAPMLRDEEVQVLVAGNTSVAGHLTVPDNPTGVVVFAHGSGSSRHSPRNRLVADVLNRAGLATLLFDLLTPAEERNRANVFDVDLLAGRLVDVTRWLARQPGTASLPVGYFGASTGAAAALVAATDPRVQISAVVSRGGRPDLADQALAKVTAPTLLIVGSRDHVVLRLNREAAAAIPGTCEIAVVPGASHVFEEPGTLDEVAVIARDWFTRYLRHVDGR